jgi:ribose transport system substrate-binding protein
MGFLDRDKHPMRFAVTCSVVGGLTFSAILALISTVTRTGLLTSSVPLWSLVVLACTLVFLAFAKVARKRKTARRTFLIIPAFSQKHWVADLIQNVHRSLDRRATDIVLKIPDKDYSGVGQMHHLRRILADSDQYDGGFVVAAELDVIRHDLVKFCTKLGKPVVMMDVEPFDDERDYPDSTAFVGYDSAGIGERAAGWVVDYLVTNNQSEPTVLVVGSRSQTARQKRFIEALSANAPDVRLILDEDGDFARMRGSTVVRRYLQRLRLEGRKLTVIFCTNDELALGAVDALYSDGPESADKIAVVGVDGTPEATALIDTGHSPLRATVVQDSYRISELAADLFERLLKGESVPRRTLLTAQLYAGQDTISPLKPPHKSARPRSR